VGVLDGLRVDYLLLQGLKCKSGDDDVQTTIHIAILFVQIWPYHSHCNFICTNLAQEEPTQEHLTAKTIRAHNWMAN
jgi:hypothetical protein